MATQNPQIVPVAFHSQQQPFFFGGSQVPETLLLSGLALNEPVKKKQKMTHYYKKKPVVIDLVSDSSSDDEPIIFNKAKGRRSRMIPALTELERRRMEQAMKEADEADYREIHRKNQELKRKYGLYRY
jgi:hypothetical protein